MTVSEAETTTVRDIGPNHVLYPTSQRIAEAHSILASEWLMGEVLHPAVKANCETVLRFASMLSGGSSAE